MSTLNTATADRWSSDDETERLHSGRGIAMPGFLVAMRVVLREVLWVDGPGYSG